MFLDVTVAGRRKDTSSIGYTYHIDLLVYLNGTANLIRQHMAPHLDEEQRVPRQELLSLLAPGRAPVRAPDLRAQLAPYGESAPDRPPRGRTAVAGAALALALNLSTRNKESGSRSGSRSRSGEREKETSSVNGIDNTTTKGNSHTDM